MTFGATLRRSWLEFLSATQFFTRVPVPPQIHETDSLSGAVKLVPAVGLLVGASAALLHHLVSPHLPRLVAALLVVTYLIFLTGCLHEDGLADTADGFGGGCGRDQILLILRDSRIGTYGAAALTLSLLARLLLLASLPSPQVGPYLIAAHVLCRWTTLPLSYFLPPARAQAAGSVDGQGARVAQLTTLGTSVGGTIFSFAVAGLALRRHAYIPIFSTIIVTVLSALYYKRRIGGITGDCFGATNQLAEIAVYLCGAWIA